MVEASLLKPSLLFLKVKGSMINSPDWLFSTHAKWFSLAISILRIKSP